MLIVAIALVVFVISGLGIAMNVGLMRRKH